MSTNDTYTGLDQKFLEATDVSEILLNLLTPVTSRQNIPINFIIAVAFAITATLNIINIGLIIGIFSKLKKISKKSLSCGKDLVKHMMHLLFSMDQAGSKLSSLLLHILHVVTEIALRQNHQATAFIHLIEIVRLLTADSHRREDSNHHHSRPRPHSTPLISYFLPSPPHNHHQSHPDPHFHPPHHLPPPPPPAPHHLSLPPPPPSYHHSPNSFPPPFAPFQFTDQMNHHQMGENFNSTWTDAFMQPTQRLGVIYDDL